MSDQHVRDDEEQERDSPSLRQRIHAATGDRDAEARTLAEDADGDVSEEDARIAVQLARGERGVRAPAPDNEVATTRDARKVEEGSVDDTEPVPVEERGSDR